MHKRVYLNVFQISNRDTLAKIYCQMWEKWLLKDFEKWKSLVGEKMK